MKYNIVTYKIVLYNRIFYHMIVSYITISYYVSYNYYMIQYHTLEYCMMSYHLYSMIKYHIILYETISLFDIMLNVAISYWIIMYYSIIMSTFEERREYCFAAVCLSVCLSVGWPTISVHFHFQGYCNDIWYTALSWWYLEQVRYWVWSSNFWQSYGPWT